MDKQEKRPRNPQVQIKQGYPVGFAVAIGLALILLGFLVGSGLKLFLQCN